MTTSETESLQKLSLWLKSYGWTVLQDKNNINDNKIFHVKGESTKKPDLIGISPNRYTIAIEVKSGGHGRDLGNYSKLMIYFENYNNEKTFYFNENNQFLLVSDFVIATYYSPDGHLKYNENLHIDNDRKIAEELRSILPKKEYETTFNLIRRGIWDNIDREKYRRETTGIGALLSSVLDDEQNSPAVFIMKPNFITHKWRQLWLKQL